VAPIVPPSSLIEAKQLAATPQVEEPKKDEPRYEEERSVVRETLETISFVVFLVLMLKAFVAEAYVIPTGSMATTLLGDHIDLVCPRCGEHFSANASNNAREIQHENNDGKNVLVTSVTCPNCRYTIRNPENASVYTGDKVLVLKPVFDLASPKRLDVVVFKYPGGPQEEFTAKNYIKRLWGLPGEKLGIWGGDLHLAVKNHDGAERLEILRKQPDKLLRMRRLINDNDRLAPNYPQGAWATSWHPLGDLLDEQKNSPWQPSNEGRVWTTQARPGTAWLRYQHNFPASPHVNFAGDRPNPIGPHLITDFLSYNSNGGSGFPNDWVGDLLVEAEVDVQTSSGKFILELNRGVLCARASFDLPSGQCTLTLQNQGKEILRKEGATNVIGVGKHRLRLANFDERLTVWVDSKLPFGDGVTYDSLAREDAGPRLADFMPASLGAENAQVSVTHLSLWRDIYYTQRANGSSECPVAEEALYMPPEEYRRLVTAQGGGSPTHASHAIKRAAWRPYYNSKVVVDGIPGMYPEPVFYPQVKDDHPSDRFNPGEYFMLGDNSLQSLDSRDWGQVPERMLLGRAIWVYYPFSSFSSIR